MTAEDGAYIELMSNVGRKYDFARGLESTIQHNAWYQPLWTWIDEPNTRCGKFYVANTRRNSKTNRNTKPEAYTAAVVQNPERGVYTVKLWLWNAHWNLILTDSYLTEKQSKGNMLAKTQWFNPNSKINNTNTGPGALEMLGWR